MKTAMHLVLGAMAAMTVACSGTPRDEAEGEAHQGVSEAPTVTRGIEANIGWEARKELLDTMRDTGDFAMNDAVIPGVVVIQHQYSIAALRLEVPSWYLSNDAHVDATSWSTNTGMGLGFPRYELSPDPSDEFEVSHRAAQKMFEAMVKATETSEVQPHDTRVTTRASARKSFTCTKTVRGTLAPQFNCLIAGVANVGGPGLFWPDFSKP